MIAIIRERFGRLIQEMAKFGVVGAIGFAVTVAGFNVLFYDVRLGSFPADAIAVIVAAAVTYVGNRFWTFRHRRGQGTLRDGVLFFVFNGIGLGIQYLPIGVTDHLLHLRDPLSSNIALVVGVAFGTLFRFTAYRRWVWGSAASPATAPASGTPAAESPAAIR